jgi:uncharacterized protein (TIGR00730 family)
MMLRSLCVFCGSSFGSRPEYRRAAEDMGALLAAHKIRLIYGGGNVGLMGALADACLAAGGFVTGVMPQLLTDKELAHRGLTELHVVKSMHERKAMMAELADAFVALPGGFGTFEEFFEVLTWTQLGLQNKACGLINVAGYYDSLLGLVDNAAAEGFLKSEHRALVLAADSATEILDRLMHFELKTVPKWSGLAKVSIDAIT